MEIPIQVAVQIYPGYPNEPNCVQIVDKVATKIPDGPVIAPAIPTGLVQINGDQHSYPVTHALPYGCDQEEIYRRTVYPMVGMFLEGYDISIVTYGQHGCGKTYTILGPGLDCVYGLAEQGIVQRAARDIFSKLTQHYRDRSFAINFGWIEICGDEIHDILGGNVYCKSIEEVFQWLNMGLQSRSQEASHNLITLTLEQQWLSPEGLIQHRLSTASFCDLCGTERMYAMNNLEQQISVPKDLGLQTLERIVSILGDQSSNIIQNNSMNLLNLYAQTTLTKLLKDSFGGRANTLLILCISPLKEDIPETKINMQFAYKVQFIRNLVMLNTFSDNNMPLSNFIYPPPRGPPVIADTGHISAPPPPVDTFGLKFAASQWLKLVANAEGLFSKLLMNNKMLNEQDRERILEWLYLKQECEECLSSGELVSNQQRLGPIQETDEPDDTATSGVASPAMEPQLGKYIRHKDGAVMSSLLTDNDSDFEDAIQQSEYIEEKITTLMEEFSIQTDELIQEKYYDFLKMYPKADHESCDEMANNNNDKEEEVIRNKGQRRGSASAVMENGGRRRSIQPGGGGGGLNLSSAELEHLHQVAQQQESLAASTKNSACRDAEQFLESSTDMHPLRIAKASKHVEDIQNKIRKISTDLIAKKEQIRELEVTIEKKRDIIDESKKSAARKRANQRINQKKAKLVAENEKCNTLMRTTTNTFEIARLKTRIAQNEQQLCGIEQIKDFAGECGSRVKDIQQSMQESKKQLNALQKNMKKNRKALNALELELQQEESKEMKLERTGAAGGNVEPRITCLDYVLEEKTDNLIQRGQNETEQALRHEIRNLRGEKDRLLQERYYLDLKSKNDKGLSDRDARKILECDVVVEVIDSAIEFKNELICGRHGNKSSKGTTSDAFHPGTIMERMGRQKIVGYQLMAQLNKLNEKEMRTLLYKCLQKIVDLRESSRQLEFQVLQLERERDEWELLKSNLHNDMTKSKLAGERHTLDLQRQQEATLTLLLQVAAEDSSLSSSNGCSFGPSSSADLMHMFPASIKNRIHPRTSADPTQQQIMTAVTTATTSTTTSKPRQTDMEASPFSEQFKPLKFNKMNILSKFLPRTYSSIGSTSSAVTDKRCAHGTSSILQLQPAIPMTEPKVTRVKNKIIIIQQNK